MATSKKLSYLLRHSKLPSIEGWLQVAFLMANYGFTRAGLEGIVKNDEKQRFEFSYDRENVRARYGHTNHVRIHYEPSAPPAVLFHGTCRNSLDAILSAGLKRMNRLYVHLSSTPEAAIKVGKRHGEPVVIEIDAQRMHEDGIPFYSLGANGIWLTSDIDPKYLKLKRD